MKTTKAQLREYLIDCKGFDEQEVEEVIADYGNDLESYLRDCGADNDGIQEVKGFFNNQVRKYVV